MGSAAPPGRSCGLGCVSPRRLLSGRLRTVPLPALAAVARHTTQAAAARAEHEARRYGTPAPYSAPRSDSRVPSTDASSSAQSPGRPASSGTQHRHGSDRATSRPRIPAAPPAFSPAFDRRRSRTPAALQTSHELCRANTPLGGSVTREVCRVGDELWGNPIDFHSHGQLALPSDPGQMQRNSIGIHWHRQVAFVPVRAVEDSRAVALAAGSQPALRWSAGCRLALGSGDGVRARGPALRWSAGCRLALRLAAAGSRRAFRPRTPKTTIKTQKVTARREAFPPFARPQRLGRR